MTKPNTIADFWSNVGVLGSNECWVWQGRTNETGYGQFEWEGKAVRAHRLAYELVRGEIPDSMVVMHVCDNPACCNPAHLKLGTQADNMHDMIEKGRGRKAKGSEHGMATLSEGDVVEIWRLLSERKTQTEIAVMYSVDRTTIGAIAAGKSWAWLTGKEKR